MSNILSRTAEIIAHNLGLVAMGLLPRHQALRLGHVIARKYPHLVQ